MMSVRHFACIVMLLVGIPGTAGLSAAATGRLQSIAISPGDAVQIEVVGYSEFNTDGIVSPDGTILVPLVGDLQIAGLTEMQLQSQLKDKLSDYIKGNIQLITTVTPSTVKRAARLPEREVPERVVQPVTTKAPIPANPTYTPPQVPANAYVIQTNDKINIKVWGYDEFNTDSIVSLGGTIDVPLIGEVRARGLAEAQLEAAVKQRLSEYVKGDIRLTTVVTPGKPDPSTLTGIGRRQAQGAANQGAGSTVLTAGDSQTTITVLGEIARQDNYQVGSELPLFELLSLAGGTTPESDLQRITIMSPTRGSIEVNLDQTMRNGLVMPIVQPGETVFIPRKKHTVRNFLTIFSAAITSATGLFLIFSFR
ncbi:MAG: hypothetical protein HN816_07190 [Gammaproteobacteria bacterium]|jgi:protein involved in polysaccharide export with SLBB domain|nr:hypothetical protein [Gammaproteobacteria bacterium]